MAGCDRRRSCDQLCETLGKSILQWKNWRGLRRRSGIFRVELQDINDCVGMNIEIGNFLVFADFFFDNFLVDLMVQQKISEMQDQVVNARINVNRVLK